MLQGLLHTCQKSLNYNQLTMQFSSCLMIWSLLLLLGITLLSFLIDIKAMCVCTTSYYSYNIKAVMKKNPEIFQEYFHIKPSKQRQNFLFSGNNTPGKFLVMHMNNQGILINFPLCTIPLKQLQITIYSTIYTM